MNLPDGCSRNDLPGYKATTNTCDGCGEPVGDDEGYSEGPDGSWYCEGCIDNYYPNRVDELEAKVRRLEARIKELTK